MSAFGDVHILGVGGRRLQGRWNPCDASGPLVLAGVGNTVGDIINKTMVASVTVPLGARPSVGAGLWLQGGIGHLARLHGLSCDSIVGAVIISVRSSQIYCVGYVPGQHKPAGAIRPKEEADLLWAIRGAGTNFGIVISVAFKAEVTSTYIARNSIIPMGSTLNAMQQLNNFDNLVTQKLDRECSADAYLYWDAKQLHLGVTTFECSTTTHTSTTATNISGSAFLGSETEVKVVDAIGLFETEMYIAGMHGGHGGGRTSSFKRCIFLKNIGEAQVATRLVSAIENRPSNLCYLHLLQGRGAIYDVKGEATAFGCRDWDFACVITGVWLREQDCTAVARSVEQWVFDVACDLLPLSCGAYSADLGPDPRDAVLAAEAFGLNLPRLARLKHHFDPYSVLAYTCPLPRPLVPKLIILVTGESCAGKDHCAEVWAYMFSNSTNRDVLARVASISDTTKREYAEAMGADLNRLLGDRSYKEQHRPELTAFFQNQVQQRPVLPQEHFLDTIRQAGDADVLLITGMRDIAPVAALSHLVPESRLIEVYVCAAEKIRHKRRDSPNEGGVRTTWASNIDRNEVLPPLNHCPTLIFDNDTAGNEAAEVFAEQSLFRFLHQDLDRLANMVRVVPNYPSPGIEFRHVLGISRQPGGLALCTSLLQTHFNGDWTNISAIACCEAGSFVNASALALRVEVPLLLIRKAGKLPPPTISVPKASSHISSVVSNSVSEERIEIERDAIPLSMPLVVIDDVLATGETLCAVLELLHQAGVSADDITVMVVAEFPLHRGRELLRQRGFGTIGVQSLLVLPGA